MLRIFERRNMQAAIAIPENGARVRFSDDTSTVRSAPRLLLLFFLLFSFTFAISPMLFQQARALSPGKMFFIYQEHDNCNHRYDMSVESLATTYFSGQTSKQERKETCSIIMNVKHDVKKFQAIMDLKVENGEIVYNGQKQKNPSVGRYLTIAMTPYGKIISSTDPDAVSEFQDAIIAFPELKLGAKNFWKVALPYKEEGKSRVSLMINEISEFKEFQGHKCAIIKSTLDIKREKTEEKDMLVSYRGKTWFDYEKGYIIAAQNKISTKYIENKKSDETGKYEKESSALTVVTTNIALVK
jgi:hypothetical protein